LLSKSRWPSHSANDAGQVTLDLADLMGDAERPRKGRDPRLPAPAGKRRDPTGSALSSKKSRACSQNRAICPFKQRGHARQCERLGECVPAWMPRWRYDAQKRPSCFYAPPAHCGCSGNRNSDWGIEQHHENVSPYAPLRQSVICRDLAHRMFDPTTDAFIAHATAIY
jgi:hypothetical protein